MPTVPSFITYLYLAGAVQGFFLALLIGLKKSENQLANRLLAILVFVFSYNTLYYYLTYNHLLDQFPHLLKTSSGAFLLFGPLIYLYVYYFSNPQPAFQRRHLVHFIPWALLILYALPVLLRSAEGKRVFIRHEEQINGVYPFDPVMLGTDVLMTALLIYYGLAIYRLSQQAPSEAAGYLRRIWVFYLLFAIGAWVYRVGVSLGLGYFTLAGHGVRLFIAVAIYALAYTAFNHPDTLYRKSRKPKYQKSPLTSNDLDLLVNRLTGYIQQEKPYLSPEFNLDQLASALNVPPQYASQVINNRMGQTFSDYVNGLRVEEAKRLLAGDDKVLAVAFDSGFNNKVSFNNAFKKATGLTPSEYRQQLKKMSEKEVKPDQN
ncbi:hypothetical protein GCM10023189_60640 [Nibrella saemangeumensis]|uniref:HTH araC/xylS-type domain-containing protein n=1 Tax=Nibrella saemangeumensis TaxID=1084526 RepID=A0ABP8NQ82_9BACT